MGQQYRSTSHWGDCSFQVGPYAMRTGTPCLHRSHHGALFDTSSPSPWRPRFTECSHVVQFNSDCAFWVYPHSQGLPLCSHADCTAYWGRKTQNSQGACQSLNKARKWGKQGFRNNVQAWFALISQHTSGTKKQVDHKNFLVGFKWEIGWSYFLGHHLFIDHGETYMISRNRVWSGSTLSPKHVQVWTYTSVSEKHLKANSKLCSICCRMNLQQATKERQ